MEMFIMNILVFTEWASARVSMLISLLLDSAIMVPLLTELLGLSGIDVEGYEVCEGGLILEVETHAESACCPRECSACPSSL